MSPFDFFRLWLIYLIVGDAIDATTVRTIKIARVIYKLLEAWSYLVEIVNSVPTSCHAEYYAKNCSRKGYA